MRKVFLNGGRRERERREGGGKTERERIDR